jgi:ribonuclease HI
MNDIELNLESISFYMITLANKKCSKFTKNGIFSVRSAYHLQMRLRNIRGAGAVSSSSVDHHKGWLGLWGADVPGKVKIHVWRLLKNGLALGSELQRRRIKGGVVCVACGRDESAIHRFWLCPHAQQVWRAVQQKFQRLELQPPPNVLSQRDLSGWLLEWIVSAKDADVEIAFMVLYQMWLARNAARDNAQIEDPEAIARRSIHLVEEWHQVQECKGAKPLVQKEHWRPPDQGWIKVNADGAMIQASGHGGGGVVARDHDGRFLAGSSHFFPSLLDPEHAELLACQKAIELAKSRQMHRVVFELDSASVVSKLQVEETDRSVHGILIEQIKCELRTGREFVVKWARRSANEVAHRLAKEGCELNSARIWLDVFPDCIKNALYSDVARV